MNLLFVKKYVGKIETTGYWIVSFVMKNQERIQYLFIIIILFTTTFKYREW